MKLTNVYLRNDLLLRTPVTSVVSGQIYFEFLTK